MGEVIDNFNITTMSRNIFKFKHGDILTTMGAVWFVSKAYNKYVDTVHDNWQRVSTYKNRSSVFRNCEEHHYYFLVQVLLMKDNNLASNTIGMSGKEVKLMALEVLEVIINQV